MGVREDYALYAQAYARLGTLTPIPADCGELCSRRCCSGDAEAGMILFPGEEGLLARADFLTMQKRSMAGMQVGFAICSGECVRALRPLSCRCYPLAPYYDGKLLRVIADPRARNSCPLLDAEEMISPAFRAAAEEAFSILLRSSSIARMLRAYAQMLDGYLQFQYG